MNSVVCVPLSTGDHSYKQTAGLPLSEQMISALPDVQTISLTPQDEFIVIACDGIWNSLSSQEVVDFVRERIGKQEKLSDICEEVRRHFPTVKSQDSLVSLEDIEKEVFVG
jgi:Serine/threonine protein phosphatase